jgi:hypothetical protein
VTCPELPARKAQNALSFLGELSMLPYLLLEGRARWRRLRICHGSHDLFKYDVAPQILSDLIRFDIRSTFSRGGPLRTFLSGHSSTLRSIVFDEVYLTNGSWKSVVQDLVKSCSIQNICLIRLYQRNAALAFSRKKLRRALKTTSAY